MTYATLQEAWGGISGSNMSQLLQSEHPAHKKQRKRRRQPPPPYKNVHDPYECMYDETESCHDVFKNNEHYNNLKKDVARGYPPGYAPPFSTAPEGRRPLLPQYPWPVDLRNQYLYYSPMLSHNFYTPFYNNDPRLIGPYYPDGFFPGAYVYPPAAAPPPPAPPVATQQRRIEHFGSCPNCSGSGGTVGSDKLKFGIIVAIFVLAAIAVITCCVLLCRRLEMAKE